LSLQTAGLINASGEAKHQKMPKPFYKPCRRFLRRIVKDQIDARSLFYLRTSNKNRTGLVLLVGELSALLLEDKNFTLLEKNVGTLSFESGTDLLIGVVDQEDIDKAIAIVRDADRFEHAIYHLAFRINTPK
jgi:hypothetical protein